MTCNLALLLRDAIPVHLPYALWLALDSPYARHTARERPEIGVTHPKHPEAPTKRAHTKRDLS